MTFCDKSVLSSVAGRIQLHWSILVAASLGCWIHSGLKSILKYVNLGLEQLPPIIFCIIILQDIIQVQSSCGTCRPPCYFRNVFWTKSKPAFKLLAEGGRRGKRLFCSSTVIYEIAHCTQTPCQGRVSPSSCIATTSHHYWTEYGRPSSIHFGKQNTNDKIDRPTWGSNPRPWD